MRTPFGITSYGPGIQRAADSSAIGETAMRASMRSIRKPQKWSAGPIQPRSPCAWCVATIGHCANESAATQIAGVIGSCRWIDVELLVLEDAAHAPDRARREHDVRQRAVRRHDDRAADGDDPLRQLAVTAAARVQEARQLSRRVVAHQDLHVVAAAAQRGGLVLGVLDHPSPVRPREGNDDPDLHAAHRRERAVQPLGAELDRLVGDGEREPRPAGAARAEALARRDRDAVLEQQRLGGEPLGQPEPDEERALAHDRLRQRRGDHVAPALVRVDALLDGVLRPFERGDRRGLERREDPDAVVVVQQVDALDDLRVADDETDAPARHAVGLRHRPHLDADVLRAGRREEALRRAAVEDEVDVRGVVHDRAVRSGVPSATAASNVPGGAHTAHGFDG